MIKLEFTVKQMYELIKQQDATWINSGSEDLSVVGHNLYKREGDVYYNVCQRIRIDNEKQRQEQQEQKHKTSPR